MTELQFHYSTYMHSFRPSRKWCQGNVIEPNKVCSSTSGLRRENKRPRTRSNINEPTNLYPRGIRSSNWQGKTDDRGRDTFDKSNDRAKIRHGLHVHVEDVSLCCGAEIGWNGDCLDEAFYGVCCAYGTGPIESGGKIARACTAWDRGTGHNNKGTTWIIRRVCPVREISCFEAAVLNQLWASWLR
jgi:hypothetical protein